MDSKKIFEQFVDDENDEGYSVFYDRIINGIFFHCIAIHKYVILILDHNQIESSKSPTDRLCEKQYYLKECIYPRQNVFIGTVLCSNEERNLIEVGKKKEEKYAQITYVMYAGKKIKDVFSMVESFWAKKNDDFLLKGVEACDEFKKKLRDKSRDIELDSVQRKLINVKPDYESKKDYTYRKRILGISGSGKTEVLILRALKCYQRKKQNVLFLTFNVALAEDIKNRIKLYAQDNSEIVKAIDVNNFDKLIVKYSGVKNDDDAPYDDFRKMCITSIINNKCNFKTYTTILIDEAQDFESSWFKIISKFIAKGTKENPVDIMVAADPMQSIYNHNDVEDSENNVFCRDVENTRVYSEGPSIPYLGFTGKWDTELPYCHRLSTRLCTLSGEFVETFLKKYVKNNNDDGNRPILENLSDTETISDYFKFISVPKNKIDASIFDIVDNLITQKKEDKNSICILANTNKTVEDISNYFRAKWNSERSVVHTNDRDRQSKVDFSNSRFSLRVTTVQSFKGMESDTIVFLLDEISKNKLFYKEEIYTAITRAKKRLIIVKSNENHEIEDEIYSFFESFNP